MSKVEWKELFVAIFFSLINLTVSFYITYCLGITNTIVIKTFSTIFGDITWEVIFFFGLSLISGVAMEYYNYKKKLQYE